MKTGENYKINSYTQIDSYIKLAAYFRLVQTGTFEICFTAVSIKLLLIKTTVKTNIKILMVLFYANTFKRNINYLIYFKLNLVVKKYKESAVCSLGIDHREYVFS